MSTHWSVMTPAMCRQTKRLRTRRRQAADRPRKKQVDAAAFLIFLVMKLTMGIRVSEEEELRGLDIGEHGMEAYSGFQIFTNQ